MHRLWSTYLLTKVAPAPKSGALSKHWHKRQAKVLIARALPEGSPRWPDDPRKSSLPGSPANQKSCWTATAPKTAYPKLAGSHAAEVVVVGAGIVGITAAYLLSEAGLSVALLEARRIGRQVTGRSTAKITTQHSLIYRHLIETFDLETAQRYADANRLGMNQIRQWVEQLGIACAFEAKDAYVYCSSPSRIRDLEAEADASRRVGLEADLLDSAPLPFSTAGALRSRNQAQFNPAQYLIGLAKAAESAGALVFEETRVTGVEESDGWQVKAGRAVNPRQECGVGDEPTDRRPCTL